MEKTIYEQRIQNRSYVKFLIGLIPRIITHLKNEYIIRLARAKGAKIGKNVTIPYKLAKIANSNLVIGNNTSIATHLIVLWSYVEIGNNVIIGRDVEIITGSHSIDSEEWETKSYGIKIEDYVWLITKSIILPSCRIIGKGVVCSAGSVVSKNIEPMSVVAGNPAVFIKKRKVLHSKLVVESLKGNDLKTYLKTYKNK